tara:strand:- start:2090 stop:2269 length:180 start_codon:yes stop_codon:yes gene_type:complete
LKQPLLEMVASAAAEPLVMHSSKLELTALQQLAWSAAVVMASQRTALAGAAQGPRTIPK